MKNKFNIQYFLRKFEDIPNDNFNIDAVCSEEELSALAIIFIDLESACDDIGSAIYKIADGDYSFLKGHNDQKSRFEYALFIFSFIPFSLGDTDDKLFATPNGSIISNF